MKVTNNAGKVIEVTETAFEVLYKERGFKPFDENESASSEPKKVKKIGRPSKS